MPLSVGDKLGPYEILAPLGVGGMGEVAIEVAIKVLPHDKLADADRERRFLQEARAASALNHPNFCQLYDIGPDYVAGLCRFQGPSVTLGRFIRRASFDQWPLMRSGFRTESLAKIIANGSRC